MSILSNHQTEALDALNGRRYGSDFQDDRPESWDSIPTAAEINAMAGNFGQPANSVDLAGLQSVVARLRSVESDNHRWGNVQRADCYALAAELVEQELARLQKPARRIEDFPASTTHACNG